MWRFWGHGFTQEHQSKVNCFIIKKSNVWPINVVANIFFLNESEKNEKPKNQTPLKTSFQRFSELEKCVFLKYFGLHEPNSNKNTPECSASEVLSVSALLKVLFRLVLDSLIKKIWKWNFSEMIRSLSRTLVWKNISGRLQRPCTNPILLYYFLEICQIVGA